MAYPDIMKKATKSTDGEFCLNCEKRCAHLKTDNGYPSCAIGRDWRKRDFGLRFDMEGRIPKSEFCKDMEVTEVKNS